MKPNTDHFEPASPNAPSSAGQGGKVGSGAASFGRMNALVDNGWLAILSATELAVWCMYHRHANGDGFAFPGSPKLKKRLGHADMRHIRRARQRLCKYGLLLREDDGKGGAASDGAKFIVPVPPASPTTDVVSTDDDTAPMSPTGGVISPGPNTPPGKIGPGPETPATRGETRPPTRGRIGPGTGGGICPPEVPIEETIQDYNDNQGGGAAPAPDAVRVVVATNEGSQAEGNAAKSATLLRGVGVTDKVADALAPSTPPERVEALTREGAKRIARKQMPETGLAGYVVKGIREGFKVPPAPARLPTNGERQRQAKDDADRAGQRQRNAEEARLADEQRDMARVMALTPEHRAAVLDGVKNANPDVLPKVLDSDPVTSPSLRGLFINWMDAHGGCESASPPKPPAGPNDRRKAWDGTRVRPHDANAPTTRTAWQARAEPFGSTPGQPYHPGGPQTPRERPEGSRVNPAADHAATALPAWPGAA